MWDTIVIVGMWAAALGIPLYTLVRLSQGPADTRFEREAALAKLNRHWHFHEINDKVAIRYETTDS